MRTNIFSTIMLVIALSFTMFGCSNNQSFSPQSDNEQDSIGGQTSDESSGDIQVESATPNAVKETYTLMEVLTSGDYPVWFYYSEEPIYKSNVSQIFVFDGFDYDYYKLSGDGLSMEELDDMDNESIIEYLSELIPRHGTLRIIYERDATGNNIETEYLTDLPQLKNLQGNYNGFYDGFTGEIDILNSVYFGFNLRGFGGCFFTKSNGVVPKITLDYPSTEGLLDKDDLTSDEASGSINGKY